MAKGEILDDDVSVPLISPAIYRDFVFPVEKRLADFHGGVAYWHDCGPADLIWKPSAAWERSNWCMPGRSPSLRCRGQASLPLPRLLRSTSGRHRSMRSRKSIASDLEQLCDNFREAGVRAYTVRLTAYRNPALDLQSDLAAVQRWLAAAQAVFSQP